MACQGCGRVANARLCCPTCIEYGRTSFFCTQECFTKNWGSHNQLHELLKKKKALAAEEGLEAGGAVSSSAAAAEAGGSSSSSSGNNAGAGSSASARPRAAAAAKDLAEKPPEPPSGLRGPRGPAPLPGGTSLVGNLKRPSGAAHAPKKEKEAVVNTGGASIVGSLVGRLASAVRGQATGPAAPQPSSSAAERGERIAAGTQPRSRAGSGSVAQPKANHGRSMRRFAAQASLWCLAVVTITAAGISYRESLRLEQPAQLADAAEVAAATSQSAGASSGPDASVAAEDVQGLRAEVAMLRERLERHDKMLRYIMDRYVEKAVPDSTGLPGDGSAGADGRAFATHEASSPGSDSLEELAHRGSAARPGDSPRKRKGGADEVASVGLPVVEGDRPVMPERVVPAEEARPPTAKADIGAVAPEGRRGLIGGSEA